LRVSEAIAPDITAVRPAMTCIDRKARNTGAAEPTWSPKILAALAISDASREPG
jgi:hypothetical protein